MRVLIIEDDVLWQMKIQVMLQELAVCQITIADSIADAQRAINQSDFDMIVSDVVLPDGLSTDFFTTVQLNVPIIFVTSFGEYEYYKQSSAIVFSAFLVKPFHALTLHSTINILKKQYSNTATQSLKNGISIIGKYGQHETVLLSNIYLIKVEGNYSIIYTEAQKYVLKISLKKLILQLNDNFIQIHKSAVINIDFMERIDIPNGCVYVHGQVVDLGRAFSKQFVQFMSYKGQRHNYEKKH
jgi:two-component system response regulator LytT